MVFGWFPWFFKVVSWFFMVFGWFSCVFKVEEMSQEADGSSCWEECAADNDGAQEAAATDQGDQGDHWITVSPRRRRQASTQEDAQVTRADHWAGPGLP